MTTQELTISEVEKIAFYLARKFMSAGEPIPDFETRYKDKLESCLLTPFSSFGGRELYRNMVDKAAVLFYLMVKNHPFQNGNKRMAVTTLLVFLFKNGWWLKIDNVQFYNFAKWVAASDPSLKDEVVAAVAKMISKHLIKNE